MAQENISLYKTVEWNNVTTVFELPKTPLNNTFLEIRDVNDHLLSSDKYLVNFSKNTIELTDNTVVFPLKITYLELPSFLTKPLSYYNSNRIVPSQAGEFRLQHNKQSTNRYIPFEGLNVSGSLSRGVTVGSNQNAVTNSNLDLQITGRLSDKIGIRASIQDNNLPLQYGGYSQKINEFDQIFIELFTDSWSIRAGDIFLENRNRRFLNFNKKIQGLSTKYNIENTKSKTTIEIAAALARGQYSRSSFKGQEGNQGPYKLKGANGELYILIVSGSEKVYVNGILLTRGEDNDYVIDYNSGEVRFTTKYPITSDMRIEIDYQYTDRNYTRFVGYGDIQHQRESWTIGLTVLSESDLKNQPLQQSLSKEQIAILEKAGNNSNKMIAPSAHREIYSENKILYKKIDDEFGATYFQFSNNPDDELYQVTFSYVGANNGDYHIISNQAISKIYEYVPPINGIAQGSYSPIVRLVAPIKTTIAAFNAKYNPSEKTNFSTEVAFSNYDANLFSSLDKDQQKGWATSLKGKQRLWTGKNEEQFNVFTDIQFIHQNFHSLENLFSTEFYRDWNLYNIKGNQSILSGGFQFTIPSSTDLNYVFEQMNYGSEYNATRHRLNGIFSNSNWSVQTQNSIMQSTGVLNKTSFIQNDITSKYKWQQQYVGVKAHFEQNKDENQTNQLLSPLSHRYSKFDFFTGKQFNERQSIEIGYQHGLNDSLQNNRLEQFSKSHTYYIKSQVLKTVTRDLNVYSNYRTMHYNQSDKPTENTVNGFLMYRDQFVKGFLQTHTLYEISSGTIAQQDYTYIEVEAGLGQYMWIDYNHNGIQELEEFEIATSPDVAKYVRLYLPSQVFIPTHQNKITQTITINPAAMWKNENGIRGVLSHFYNQTSYTIDRKDLRKDDSFSLNPFRAITDQTVGLIENFNTFFYYNRGIKKHSVTYGYTQSKTKNLLSFGTTENNIQTHQLMYNHLIQKTWFIDLSTKRSEQTMYSSSYNSKNYLLTTSSITPSLSYLFSDQANIDVFYNYQAKQNQSGDFESLYQHRLGVSFLISNPKFITVNGEVSLFDNIFTGNSFSPVAYQMLEGLQPGKNVTWRIMLQKNITNYLDINLNYQGRSNQTTPSIHTGNIQLRAFF